MKCRHPSLSESHCDDTLGSGGHDSRRVLAGIETTARPDLGSLTDNTSTKIITKSLKSITHGKGREIQKYNIVIKQGALLGYDKVKEMMCN